MRWRHTAAQNGHTKACLLLARCMYGGEPYAREVGHVEEPGVTMPAGVMERHESLRMS